MGQSNCSRAAAALSVVLFGFPPAFAMDRVAIDREAGGTAGAPGVTADTTLDSRARAPRSCPTRFDYVVLASFADAPSLLSLSTYHFRSEVSFGTIPLSGFLRVDYQVEPDAGDCRSRGFRQQT